MVWITFGAVVIVALFIDFFAMSKQGAHRVSLKEATIWSLIWVALSLLFALWFWWNSGGLSTEVAQQAFAHQKALEFITGYLIEKALAVDNIFVFLLVFTYFRVPRISKTTSDVWYTFCDCSTYDYDICWFMAHQ